MPPLTVEVYKDCTPALFRDKIEPRREPAVLRGLDLGPCLAEWSNPQKLASKLQPRTVRTHVTQEENMSFTAKNFKYCDMDIRELVKRAAQDTQQDFFISERELYYLRSVTADARSVQVSRLQADFPELSDDFRLPELFEPDRFFSSVLRISSGGVRVWTHYDVMDNVYCQIVGHKTAVLWPPHEASRLYLDGKSGLLNTGNGAYVYILNAILQELSFL
jgi:tRNA wybutosine-synthesizing protein 5